MCLEWASKYEELKAYIKEDLAPHAQIYKQALKNISKGKIGNCCCAEEYALNIIGEVDANSKTVDLGFWNKDGEYIEDIQEIKEDEI